MSWQCNHCEKDFNTQDELTKHLNSKVCKVSLRKDTDALASTWRQNTEAKRVDQRAEAEQVETEARECFNSEPQTLVYNFPRIK